MSSDGKGLRKHRRPLCPKCSDLGYVFQYPRLVGRDRAWNAKRVRCTKCAAGKRWSPV